MSGRTALYRLYDAAGVLLYIGISSDPDERWKRHAMFMPWWPQVATKDVQWVSTWQEAARFEEDAIRSEAPLHNGTHNYPLAPFNASEWFLAGTPRKVHALAEMIRQKIDSGAWLPGQRIPGCSELGVATGTSKSTAMRAVRILQEEGRLQFLHGFGVFVYEGIEILRRNRQRPVVDANAAA